VAIRVRPPPWRGQGTDSEPPWPVIFG
jgi:hypothetical protein